ncbi:MAG: hypothetical protein ABEJ46_00145, partial [Gemmatimonadota bacterium]
RSDTGESPTMNRITTRLVGGAAAAALVLTLAPGAASAQMAGGDRPVNIDLRGGLNVPTFDITDAARAGPSFGAGLGLPLGPRLTVRANADFGFHPGAEAAVADPPREGVRSQERRLEPHQPPGPARSPSTWTAGRRRPTPPSTWAVPSPTGSRRR